MMKIGIGVTSYNRPKHLELFKKQVQKYLGEYNAMFYEAIDTDKDRKGIAARKNECLNHLKDCEHIFLFDDDCFPIAEGWIDYIIGEHERTKQHHFLYLKDTSSIIKTQEIDGINVFNNCGGCFMYLTKEVINKVGGFSKDYGVYGFEHAGYSKRIKLAGLNTFGAYLSPDKIREYIYSLDYDTHLDFDIVHKSSITIDEVFNSMEKNHKVFKEDIKTIYQPL